MSHAAIPDFPDRPERVVDASYRPVFNWRELWHYRELLYFFAWRDVKIKYKQTVLGFLWAVLQPLLMMIIFTFFFGRALGVPSQGVKYPVFVFSGLLIWNAFSAGLSNAANSMVNNASIIKKIYFPRLIIPVASILVAVFDFVMAFLLFIPVLLYYRQPVHYSSLWLWPAGLAVSILGSLGLGTWLSALNVKYRDFRYLLPFLIQVMFFVSPVLYPVTVLPHQGLQYVIAASPLYAAIELFRWPVTGIAPDPWLMLISLSGGALLLLAGLLYFRRTEDFFADFA